MADFTALKNSIRNYIKQNGNAEITGEILQNILISMVVSMGDGAINGVAEGLTNEANARTNADGLLQNAINSISTALGDGYTYAGIATPATTPTSGRVFYLALQAGTYTNFGGVAVTKGINILKNNDGTWQLDNVIGIDDAPTAGSPNLVTSEGVAKAISYYTEGSALSNDVKNWLRSNIDAILLYDADYAEDRKYGVSYVMLNHSALGGSGYLGFQIEIKDSSNNVLSQDNYKILATSLEPYSTYVVPADSGDNILYIRTAESYSWEPSTQINAGDVLSLRAKAIGKDVLPFIEPLKDRIINDETEIEKRSEKVTRQAVTLNYEWLKSTRVDYRSLVDVVTFPQNLFNKGIVINGYYAVDGRYDAVSNYSATLLPIPLKKGTTYKSNFGSAIHIDILRNDTLGYIKHIVYDSTGWDITYDSEEGTLQFTVPNDLDYDVCALFSCQTDSLSTIKIVEGADIQSKSTKFVVEFGEKEDVVENNYVVVDKNGNGDYTTLTAATNAEPSGTTFIVMPGVYDNECITAGTSKTMYIIGVDRDKCIIKNNLGEYQYAVIHISSGLLRNLTVIQEGTDPGQTSGAYGVHADFNTGQNSSLRIENCHLQSNVPDTGGIGIGLRQNMNLTIKGCRLVSGTSGRALYAHDDDGGSGGAQYLRVIDCILESPNQALIIQGQGKPDRDFSVQQYYIEFCRNIIKGTLSFINWYADPGTITSDDFQGVKNLRLVGTSWGNSANVLNANLG